MPRIPFAELKAEFKRVLIKKGCDEATADLSAQLMTETSCDGVYSHGVNRFPRVVEYIEKGYIDLKAKPSKTDSMGAFERWNGNLGLGNVNAKLAMDRAIELAREHGIGCVALRSEVGSRCVPALPVAVRRWIQSAPDNVVYLAQQCREGHLR